MIKKTALLLCAATAAALVAASTALSAAAPPGDIPDNQAWVVYKAAGSFGLKVPEGWARTTTPGGVTFADKYNSIRVDVAKSATAPSVSSAKKTDVAALAKSVKGFKLIAVSSVKRAAGTAILITYRGSSAPNAVTGKSIATSVERYEFWKAGRLAALTVEAPAGSDNVDPWKIVTNSFRWA
jgi:hypothetical protein